MQNNHKETNKVLIKSNLQKSVNPNQDLHPQPKVKKKL